MGTTLPMPLILSIILLVAVALASMYFIQIGKAGFDPSKLMEGLTPGSEYVTEGEYPTYYHKYNIDDVELDRIFTTSGPHDLSEVACFIGDKIFEDYSTKGATSPRSECGTGDSLTFYKGYKVCVVDDSVKSFIYMNGTDQANIAANENTISTKNPGCHICKMPTGAGGGTGIQDLDQTCINLQLRDRKVESLDFCKDKFSIGSDLDISFGNCIDDGTPNSNNFNGWNDECKGGFDFWGSYSNCNNPPPSTFCDNNDKDMIAWDVANGESAPSQFWDRKIGVAIYSTEDKTDTSSKFFNNYVMYPGKKYMMGIFWVPDVKGYGVVFAMDPTESPKQVTSYAALINELNNIKSYKRTNILGPNAAQMRTTGAFIFEPPTDVSIADLRNETSSKFGISLDKVQYKEGCTESSCTPIPQFFTSPKCDDLPSVSDASETFKNAPILLVSNATNPEDNNKPVGINGKLKGGRRYEILVRMWAGLSYWCGSGNYFINKQGGRIIFECGGSYGMQPCLTGYDRSISILQVSQSCTFNSDCPPSMQCIGGKCVNA